MYFLISAVHPHAHYSQTLASLNRTVFISVYVFTRWNLFVLNKYKRERDVRRDVLRPRSSRYEDSGAAWASVAAGFSEGVSLTAGVSVASRMSAGVCWAAKETGGMWSDGAREDGSVTPGMLGSVEGRTVCMGRAEMPGRFRGGRGGKPAQRERERDHINIQPF